MNNNAEIRNAKEGLMKELELVFRSIEERISLIPDDPEVNEEESVEVVAAPPTEESMPF